MNFHLAGSLQSFLFLFALAGQLEQFLHLRRRIRSQAGHEVDPTSGLSLNLMAMSFAAFFCYWVYSGATVDFNYYLFWTRLPACILGLVILREIATWRSSAYAIMVLLLAALTFLLGACFLLAGREVLFAQRSVWQLVMVTIGLMLAQGQVHQIWTVKKKGEAGGLSTKARTLNLLKDISAVLFGLSMGWVEGWPITVVAGINSILTATLLAVIYGQRKIVKS